MIRKERRDVGWMGRQLVKGWEADSAVMEPQGGAKGELTGELISNRGLLSIDKETHQHQECLLTGNGLPTHGNWRPALRLTPGA